MSKDTEIQKYGNLSLHEENGDDDILPLNNVLKTISFYVEENSNYDLLINNSILNDDQLSIQIKYLDQEKRERELLIPLKLKKVFSNDKFIYEGGNQF